MLPRAREWEARRLRNPDEPWLWRDDWATGEVVWKALGAKSVWTMAIVYNLILGAAALATPLDKISRAGPAALAALMLLPAGGLVFLAWAARRTLRGSDYGRFALALETVPATPGGQLRGTVDAFCGGSPKGGFDVRLTCLKTEVILDQHSAYSSQAQIRPTHSTPLWQSAYNTPALPSTAHSKAVAIPVHFDLPDDVAETSREFAQPYDSLVRERDGSVSISRTLRSVSGLPPVGTRWVHWQLAISGALPTDLATCVFDVPVFVAPAEESRRRRDRGFEARPLTHSTAGTLHFEPLASGGSQMVFPPRKEIGWALACSLGVVAGSAAVAWSFPGAREVAFMIGLVAVFFSGLFGAAALRSVRRIQVCGDEVSVTLGLWVLSRTRRFQGSRIAAIEKDGMFGQKEAATFACVVRSHDGVSFRFDSTLGSDAEVERMLEELRGLAGVRPQSKDR